MPTLPPPPASPPDDGSGASHEASGLLRFGAVAGAALLASGLAAAPPALRVAGVLADGTGRGWVWLAATGALVLPMLVAISVLRGARIGLRSFAGEGSGRRLVAALLWAVLFGAWLGVFGAALRATTHHHALAGATFAVVSVGAGVVLAVVASRAASIVFDRPPPIRDALLAFVAASLALVAMIAAARLGRAPATEGAPATAELVVDGLAFAIAALLASRPELTRRRAVALMGPPLAAVVLVTGLSELRGAPALAAALEARAPACAPIVRIVAEH